MVQGKKYWIVLFIVALFVLANFKHSRAESSVSPWLVSLSPTISDLGILNPTDYSPTTTSNRNCQNREIITRPERLLPTPQTKQSHVSCVVDTKFGTYSASNNLQRPGSDVSGSVKLSYGGSATLLPIPRSSTGITLAGATYGHYLFFWDNLDKSLSSNAIWDGTVTHYLPATSPAGLKDADGHTLPADVGSISFSTNGDWMVADVPFVGTVRVNTLTRQVLPFGPPNRYNIGLGPGLITSISQDGKYALVASTNFDFAKLYDLSTCSKVPTTITKNVDCNYKDLLPFFRSQVNGYTGLISARFKSNFTVDLYINSKIGPVSNIHHLVMTANGQEPAYFQYLALGDSFASGEGAYQYKAQTDTTVNKCHLSQRSYPYLISSVLGYSQYESVACSGAKIEDVLSQDDEYKGQVNDNIKRKFRNLDLALSSFSPGYFGQIEFPAYYQPKVITLSAVGNDVGFSDKIIRCLDTDTCYSSYEDRLEIIHEINAQFYHLTDMYTQLKLAGDPQAKIYVIGYPQISNSDGNCAANVHLNHSELVFANQLVSYLNSVVKLAAENVGVAYIDTENAFVGRRFCETDSWNVAVNGLTAGNDIVDLPFIHGPIGNESFHPNHIGHDLLKTKILQQTNSFTLAMPAPNPNLSPPGINETIDFLNVPKTNRIIRSIKNVTGTNGGVIEIGKTWVTSYSSVSPLIKTGSVIHGWLNSAPVDLGLFKPDINGDLTVSITLPDTVPAGFHTLHLYGENVIGDPIDFYQTVYVAGNSPSGECLVVPSAGTDTDKDGVDDACDPYIDQPPLEVILSSSQDPKPPVNNPETVAGFESLSTADAFVTTASTQTTYSLPNQNNTSSAPQVLAAESAQSTQSKDTLTQDIPDLKNPYKTKNSPWLKALYALLSLATATIIVKVIRHPK